MPTFALRQRLEYLIDVASHRSSHHAPARDPSLLRNVLSSFLSATHFAAPKSTTDGEASALRLYWEPYCKDIGIDPVRSEMEAHSGKDVDGYAIECAYIAGLLP